MATNKKKANDMSKMRSELYADIVNTLGNCADAGKCVDLYSKVLFEGLKVIPTDKKALSILEYCMDAATETQRAKLLTEGTFGLVSLRARPLYETAGKVSAATWNGSDKISSLFESGSWTDNDKKSVNLKTLK